MSGRIELPPCEILSRAYLSGLSTPMLAKQYGCSPTTIANYLRRCGIPLRSAHFRPIAICEETLRRLYLDEKRPIAAIADYFGVSVSTIGNKRRSYQIPPRPRSRTKDPSLREGKHIHGDHK